MTYLKRLFSWFKNILIWIYDGKLFWIFLCLLIVSSIFKCGYAYFGTGLQLLGIVTIVIGINNKVKLFNKESPLKFHFKYFSRFPSFKPKNINLNISDVMQLTDMQDAYLIQHAKKPDQTFADLIRYIDEENQFLGNQISDIRTDLHDQINVLKKQIFDLKQEIESNINKVERKLEFSSTADISLELFGAGCIAAGLIFSILPLIFFE
jgi:hypothetical protein